MSEPPEIQRSRGRPRREGADEQILAIALGVLREKGYRDLTVDVVAERAGVAKTTVYRRWPSKGALVAAAIAPLTAEASEDPEAVLRDICAILRLIGSADGDAEMVDVVRAAIAPRRRLLRDALGDDLVADFLIGALLVRLFITHEPLDDVTGLVNITRAKAIAKSE